MGTPALTDKSYPGDTCVSGFYGNIESTIRLITVKPKHLEFKVLLTSRRFWAIPWEVGGMTNKQKSVILGSILGDGFLQQTGKNNARLRLEHGLKQKEYLIWKYK